MGRAEASGIVVLVTGGSGFVGRHLVRLLVEKGENIAEVRIFDVVHPEVEFTSGKALVTYIKGDVRNLEALREACKDVDAVINSAVALDTSRDADMKYMSSVNITGTENIIKVCREESIEYLIHTSSSEVMRTFSERHNLTEEEVDSTPVTSPSDLIFPAYALTKKQSEERVLSANGVLLKNGKRLKALSLRPCGIYGEGDTKYVIGFIKNSLALRCTPIVGGNGAQVQRVYVGNVAWAHVHALNVLRKNGSKSVDGQAYHVIDGSTTENNFTWVKPFLELHHIKLLPISVPLWLVYYFVFLMETLLLLVSPLFKMSMPVSRFEIFMGSSTATYSGAKAYSLLNYTPLYTTREAHHRSLHYYSKLKF